MFHSDSDDSQKFSMIERASHVFSLEFFMSHVEFSVILDPSGDRILSPSCIVDYVTR